MKISRFFEPMRAFYQRVQQEHLGLYAAQASFFLIISFVPLLMLLVTLLQFVLPIQKEELITALNYYLPDSMETFVSGIVDDLFSQRAVSIISASTLMLLWSASRGVHSVIQGIRHIFHVPQTIYYKERLRALVYTIALILTILFALIVLVFGNSLWSLITNLFPPLGKAGGLVTLAKFLISALLITLFSLLFYCATAPRHLAKLSVQFPGALFTAAGWILFSTGFSLYITNFSNYSYIYGSLTALILLMLWLYICMWLMFLGAEINCTLALRRQSGAQIRIEE